MRLIGINGYARSGKDTVYEFIEQLQPAKVKRVAYADKMKVMAARSLGFDRPEAQLIELMNSVKLGSTISVRYIEHYGGDDKLHSLTGREFIQNFGEDGRQTFGEDFWIDLVLPTPVKWSADPGENAGQIERDVNGFNVRDMHNADVVVVTDCRHPNEAQRVLDLDGEIWHVVRPGVESDGHITETRLPPWLIDRTIINGGSLGHLRDRVKEALDAERD